MPKIPQLFPGQSDGCLGLGLSPLPPSLGLAQRGLWATVRLPSCRQASMMGSGPGAGVGLSLTCLELQRARIPTQGGKEEAESLAAR